MTCMRFFVLPITSAYLQHWTGHFTFISFTQLNWPERAIAYTFVCGCVPCLQQYCPCTVNVAYYIRTKCQLMKSIFCVQLLMFFLMFSVTLISSLFLVHFGAQVHLCYCCCCAMCVQCKVAVGNIISKNKQTQKDGVSSVMVHLMRVSTHWLSLPSLVSSLLASHLSPSLPLLIITICRQSGWHIAPVARTRISHCLFVCLPPSPSAPATG